MLRRVPLATPFVLWLAASGCSSAEPAPVGVRTAFPNHAARITETGRPFDAVGNSFVLLPQKSAWGPNRLEVRLPKVVTAPVRMRLDAVGMEFDVFELDLEGDASRDGDAIRYPRRGGVSYWSGVPGGVEEWLVLDDGVADYQVPVASWIVSGATLAQSGPAVIVYDLDGQARVRVTADEAYGPNGNELGTQLRVVGDRIDLFVAESPGPVLIDPQWADMATLGVQRFLHASTLLLNDRVLTSGGVGGISPTPQDTSELYDATLNTWSAVVDPMNQERVAHTLTTLDDGRALAHGGHDGFGAGVFPEADVFDPAGAGTWESSGYGYCFTAGFHTATKLTDGRVLFTGGLDDGGASGAFGAINPGPSTDCAELFEPLFDDYELPGFGSGQFLLLDQRSSHTATKLTDDTVLIAGGEHFGLTLSSAEQFDPISGEFSFVSSMLDTRAGHTSTLLCNGDVLVAGGIQEEQIPSAMGLGGGPPVVLATAEYYDFGQLPFPQWKPTTNTLLTPRWGHTANLLPDCTVLVVGGFTNLNMAVATAEIYDPLTNSWSLATSIPGARGNATGTTLANGDILVASGYDGTNAVTDSWEYQARGDGTGCTIAAQCASGFCVDGVCCDTQCDSPCESCTDALKEVSDGDGVCGGTASGTDPDNECTDMGLATCGTNGACDGTPGACAVYAQGTVCNPSACGTDEVVEADTCNGDAQTPACVDGGITDCGAYTCSAATCLTSCTTIADCAGSHYCDALNGNCEPQKPLGDPADDDEQCLSGFVADGVCCDAACNNGICDACTVALGASADGSCSDIITCSDDNSCTIDACHPVNGCISNSVLDGAACEGGICVAGTCIPDPDLSTSAGSGIGTGGGSGGAGGDTSTGSAGDALGDPRLEGGGICQATIAGGPTNEEKQPMWLLLAALPFLRRRRRDD